jgi:hypothetical protein
MPFNRRSSCRVITAAGVIVTMTLTCDLAGDCVPAAELSGPNLDLSTGITTNLGGRSVAYNSTDNEFLVAWFDSRIPGQNDVYAQRVSATGGLVGANVTIISGSNSQTDTAVTHNAADNEYLVTWRNQGGPPGSPGFNHAFGRVVSAAGSPLTTAVDISAGGLEATLTFNDVDNEYFLEARNFAGGGAAGIYARRVTSLGVPTGGNIIITTSGAPAPAGQVAYNGVTSQYLATWRDQTNRDCRGRVINTDGTFATAAFIISAVFPSSDLAASVAFDSANGRYLVVFGTFSGGPIIGQFVTTAGTLDGPSVTLVESASSLFPFLAFDPVHEVFLLAWRDGGTIDAQLLGADGGLFGDPLTIVSGTTRSSPRIASNTNGGGFLVAWSDSRNSPDHNDAFAQLVTITTTSPCVGDIDCDGFVGIGDLLALLAAWGPNPGHPADFNGDDFVGINDLLTLLANWGACPE